MKESTILLIGKGQLFLNAFIWLGAAIAGLLILNSLPASILWLVMLTDIIMLGFGAVLAVCGILLQRGRKAVFYAALLLSVLSVLGIIFDDLGWVDVLAMLPGLASVIFLLTKKAYFLTIDVSEADPAR